MLHGSEEEVKEQVYGSSMIKKAQEALKFVEAVGSAVASADNIEGLSPQSKEALEWGLKNYDAKGNKVITASDLSNAVVEYKAFSAERALELCADHRTAIDNLPLDKIDAIGYGLDNGLYAGEQLKHVVNLAERALLTAENRPGRESEKVARLVGLGIDHGLYDSERYGLILNTVNPEELLGIEEEDDIHSVKQALLWVKHCDVEAIPPIVMGVIEYGLHYGMYDEREITGLEDLASNTLNSAYVSAEVPQEIETVIRWGIDYQLLDMKGIHRACKFLEYMVEARTVLDDYGADQADLRHYDGDQDSSDRDTQLNIPMSVSGFPVNAPRLRDTISTGEGSEIDSSLRRRIDSLYALEGIIQPDIQRRR